MNNKQFNEFLRILKEVKGKNLFNPYTDVCVFHDLGVNSPFIRSNNLRQYFSIIDRSNYLFIGEAAGYIGCRRTGLPFTDEYALKWINKIYKLDLQRATKSGKNKELSASQVWGLFSKLVDPPFLWNIVPFHPYKEGNQLTNRTPIPNDHKIVKGVVTYFLDNTNFDYIYAVGKVSQKILEKLNYKVDYIRHPSHGGAQKFREKIAENFIFKEEKNPLNEFFGD
ncbi:MAG: uracil-DNA glycosylase [Candidatus Kariarchaeaceae archaeon]|jgi:hypothetical protein